MWTSKNGKVFLGYTPPSELKTRYEITDKDEIFDTMSKALDAMTTAAVAAK